MSFSFIYFTYCFEVQNSLFRVPKPMVLRSETIVMKIIFVTH